MMGLTETRAQELLATAGSIAQGAGISRSTVGRIEARRDVYENDDG